MFSIVTFPHPNTVDDGDTGNASFIVYVPLANTIKFLSPSTTLNALPIVLNGVFIVSPSLVSSPFGDTYQSAVVHPLTFTVSS